MSLLASRLVGAALMLAGIAVALWVVFGVPQEWTGGMRWLRSALALASFGAISLAVRFFFPDGSDSSASSASSPGASPDGIPSGSPDGVGGSWV
ncbi:hypothetical protein [Streptomyces europaeiscabiei]|uniref:hypothetical protein n=1 Tax=Streptomyces europaeiscabiei TaxID=146819 RepID=UPI000A68D557|nr:hypothetical protein [Streptomyces europaeiscabiei]MDX2525555.1 hypothetical protein [Streptomyces europaeiscabiei]MDX3667453.1 hypothetical protein [Streptomyces europaeiscabiei]MDX3708709.1 hypothetical protein [Streptomyces europaeiscabiei]